MTMKFAETMRRLVDDFYDRLFPVFNGRRFDQRPQGLGDPPLLPDDLADIVLGHVQLENLGRFPFDHIDPDIIRLVD